VVAPSLKKTITRLDLLSLRLFLAVCDEESIGKAAEREGIAASAVTKRIQDLEDLFGVTLLYRHRKGTVPTPVGATLAQHARSIFQAVETVRVELSDFAQGIRGHIRLNAIPSAIVGFLARDIRIFAELHPQVNLDIHEELNPGVLHSVQTSTADIGVISVPANMPDTLETFPYRSDELVVLLPVGHVLAAANHIRLAELMAADLIALSDNSAVMKLLYREALELGKSLQPRYKVQSNDVAIAMVAAGLGVTIVPRALLASTPYPDALVIVNLAESWALRSLRICVRKNEALPVPVRELLAFLREQGASTATP